MSILIDALDIKHVAWRWDGTSRVYRAHTLSVEGQPEMETFELANFRKETVVQGVWLFFGVDNEYFERINPASSTGNDWIDVLNAMNDPSKTVEFFPIWDHDNSIKYQVKPFETGRKTLLKTSKTLFKPESSIRMQAAEMVADYPDWLRTTKYRQ